MSRRRHEPDPEPDRITTHEPDFEAEPDQVTEHEPGDFAGAIAHTKWKLAYQLEPMPPDSFARLNYSGGKWHIGKEFLAAMIEAHRKPGQTYVEPFVGGANVMWQISDNGDRVGSDAFEPLIDFWEAVKGGWAPDPAVPTRAQYNDYREKYRKLKDWSGLTREERAQVVWIGFACSNNGGWFNGYRTNKISTGPLNEQRPLIQSVQFLHGDYAADHSNRTGDLIYCDVPYANRRGFDAVGEFDTPKFWDWASEMAERENTVLVSEETLPDDRHIEDTEPYMAGPHRDRQEYLIRVKASRPRTVRKI